MNWARAEVKTVICNYSATPETLRVAARLIYGEIEAERKLMLKN